MDLGAVMRKLALSDDILLKVEKPARYIGNEINSVVKNKEEIAVRFAMCFPDVYEIGMSHLGIQILYDMFNHFEDTWCERVYSPWPDLDTIMREKQIALFALESQDPIKDFDFLGITIQYEMCYTNILQILDLSQIPLMASERTWEHPIVIGGGPCSYNPEPIADLLIYFILEKEKHNTDHCWICIKNAEQIKFPESNFLPKQQNFLECMSHVFYEVSYNEDGTIHSFEPTHSDIPRTILKEIVPNVSETYYPEKPVVPFIK